MNKIEGLALTCLIILPSLSVKSEEIVLPPSKAEIEAFNACLRKGPMPCVLPTRTVIIPDDDPAPDMTPAPRQFYQAPPDELVTGSTNKDMRDAIRNADGYRTYQWGPLRTQDGPPEPFGSYAQDRSAGVDRGRGDDGGGGPDSGNGGGSDPSSGSGSGPSDPGGDAGGGSDTGSGGPGQAGGADCRR